VIFPWKDSVASAVSTASACTRVVSAATADCQLSAEAMAGVSVASRATASGWAAMTVAPRQTRDLSHAVTARARSSVPNPARGRMRGEGQSACATANSRPSSPARALDGPADDAPILSVAAGSRTSRRWRRSGQEGLEVIDATALAHVDVPTAPAEQNPTIAAIERFLDRNVPSGTVAAPAL
jgi:hypothetical protein